MYQNNFETEFGVLRETNIQSNLGDYKGDIS